MTYKMPHLKVQEDHVYPGLGIACAHREARLGVETVWATDLAGEMQLGYLLAAFCEFIGNCVMCVRVCRCASVRVCECVCR